MRTNKTPADQPGRDGLETQPEPDDLPMPSETSAAAKRHKDDLLDEALRETFPASDPITSGRFD